MSARIALVGNPNCGKTTLFNALTGLHQKVANWPGVTVDQVLGRYRHANDTFDVIDLPGIFGIDTHSSERNGSDEEVAHEFLSHGHFDLILNVLDASTLSRGLYLTSQLLNLNRPVVVVLNMMDMAATRGIHIDINKLSEWLQCPVIPLVATKPKGLLAVRDKITSLLAASAPHSPNATSKPTNRPAATPSEHPATPPVVPATAHTRTLSPPRSDEVSHADTEQPLNAFSQETTARYRWVDETIQQTVREQPSPPRLLSDRLDAIFLNRWLAPPLFLLVMYLMFFLTINIGGAFIGFFDGLFGALVVELPRALLTAAHAPAWFTVFVADGIGGGVQLVASFIPVIGVLFLCLTFLEDSGYMSRVSVIVDWLMARLGLPGKSFVPLIVGFGCNVPAVMATRCLHRRQDRLLTTIMAPFMSCSARLTVYALFATAFFPTNGLQVIFGLYLVGIALAIMSGLVIRRFMLESSTAPFLMELPDYHIPTLRNLLLPTWHKLQGFIMRAGKAIVLVVMALNIISSWGTDGTFGNENMEKSWLSVIGKTITPVFEPMGIQEDNWPATVGIFTGLFAKEVVVGTLDSLYGNLNADQASTDAEDAPFDLLTALGETFSTLPENLRGALYSFSDPLGLSIVSATDSNVSEGTLSAMKQLFNGTLGAFSYLLFVLLYVPCVATLGAVHKEQGVFWAGFSALWSTIIAYAVAVFVYQTGALLTGLPNNASLWVPAMLLFVLVGYSLLIWIGRWRVSSARLIPVVQIE